MCPCSYITLLSTVLLDVLYLYEYNDAQKKKTNFIDVIFCNEISIFAVFK